MLFSETAAAAGSPMASCHEQLQRKRGKQRSDHKLKGHTVNSSAAGRKRTRPTPSSSPQFFSTKGRLSIPGPTADAANVKMEPRMLPDCMERLQQNPCTNYTLIGAKARSKNERRPCSISSAPVVALLSPGRT